MSKLAHSNDETMRQIERDRAKEDGVYCETCDGTSEKAPWCQKNDCPHETLESGWTIRK